MVIRDRLDVIAANGLVVPYSDYFVVDLKMGDVLEENKGLLIVNDKGLRRNVGLLGTNIPRDVSHVLGRIVRGVVQTAVESAQLKASKKSSLVVLAVLFISHFRSS